MSTATVNLVEVAAIWRSARRLYPIYSALNVKCALGMQPCRELESPIDRTDPQATQQVEEWLTKMDSMFQVHQLRQFMQSDFALDEAGLRALLKRQLDKPAKDNSVRDKVDYLLVQYYVQFSSHDSHDVSLDHDHVSEVLQPVLGYASPAVPDFCLELDRILLDLDQCSSLGHLLDKKLLDRSRNTKEVAGQNYFDPSVLVAFTRFNFLFRRGFLRLMQADLHAIRLALRDLEGRGQTTCNGTSAGLSANLSFTEVREICHKWKKPFAASYSSGNKFEQLVSLRSVLESEMSAPSGPATAPEAAAPAHQEPAVDLQTTSTEELLSAHEPALPSVSDTIQLGSIQDEGEFAPAIPPVSAPPVAISPQPQEEESSEPEPANTEGTEPQYAKTQLMDAATLKTILDAAPVKVPEPAPVASAAAAPEKAEEPAAPAPAAEVLNITLCIQRIGEALVHVPRSASVTNFIFQGSNLMLASWEVIAFMRPTSLSAPVLRRAVATRALVLLALDRAKRGAPSDLAARIADAHVEVARLVEQVAEAKERRDIDGAVNLAATSRLVSTLIERAEKVK